MHDDTFKVVPYGSAPQGISGTWQGLPQAGRPPDVGALAAAQQAEVEVAPSTAIHPLLSKSIPCGHILLKVSSFCYAAAV